MRIPIASFVLLIICSASVQAQNDTYIPLALQVTDAVFDTNRGLVYITDKSAKTLSFISLRTGQVEKSISFELFPSSVAIRPQGDRLYVALLATLEYTFSENPTGDIAIIDLETQTQVDQFTIDVDPFDIAVSSDGYLYAVSSTRLSEPIISYALDDPSMPVDRERGYENSILRLHPDESRLYAATTRIGPSDVEQFTLSQGRFIERWDSPYHGDHRFDGNIFIHPDGEYLLSKGGDIFGLSDVQDDDLIYQRSVKDVPITDAVFDSGGETLFTVVGSAITYYDLPTLFERGQFPLRHVGQFISVVEDTVYVLTGTSGSTNAIEKFAHPHVGEGNSNAPVVNLVVTPGTEGTTQTTFLFDASSSTDDTTPLSSLLFSWDLDGDGENDPGLDNPSQANWRYNLAGLYTARLEVTDQNGYMTAVSQDLNIRFEADPDSLPGVSFPFFPTDVVYDYKRSRAYVSSKSDSTLYRINLQTGLVEQEYAFEYMPEFMTLDPDSSTLYLALLTREHNGVWQDGSHEGYIAVFDLESGAKKTQYRINEDPYGLVVTNDGYLYVSSGSGQTTFLRSYLAEDGTEVGHYDGVRERVPLQLNAAGTVIYGADGGNHQSDLYRWTINAGQIQKSWYAPEWIDYRVSGDLFLSPVGDKLITRGGDVFSVSEQQSSDLLHIGRLSENWPLVDVAYDIDERAVFALYESELRYYNETNLQLAGTIDLGMTGQSVGVKGDSVYVFAFNENNIAHLFVMENPIQGAGGNSRPTAILSIDPPEGNTRTLFTLDASASDDAETEKNRLLVRWDWESDGVFDTPFNATKIVERQFPIQDTYTITLEVKDHLGAVKALRRELVVNFDPDPGSVSEITHDPFELPFDVDDVLFDPESPYAYASSKSDSTLYIVNLESGMIERLYSFGFMPEAIALDPAEETMYIALLTREHGDGWENGQFGYITAMDRATLTILDQFFIDEDPSDLIVTPDGYLFVSSGSGQWTRLASYRLSDRSYVGETNRSVREGTRIKLHPSGTKLYGADVGLSPSDIHRFSILEGQVTEEYDSPYHVEYRKEDNVFIHPSGDYLLTRGGDVFRATDDQATDMEYVVSLENGFFKWIEDMYFDEVDRTIFAVGQDSLWRFDYDDFSRKDAEYLPMEGSFVHVYGDTIYVLSDQDAEGLHIMKFNVVPVANQPDPNLPTAFGMDQNFPNPFQGSTSIRLAIPDPAHVMLTIYDLAGREITTLVNQELQVGYHEVTWTPRSLSTGVYFARITSEGQRDVITLTHVR